MNKYFWLYVYPSVYVSSENKNILLLYNTLSGGVTLTENMLFRNLVEKVHDPNNLGVIRISKHTKDKCGAIINETLSKGIIGLQEISDGNKIKPINLLPYLSLQSDFDDKDNIGGLSDNIVSYLSTLNLHILPANRYCNDDEKITKQLPYPSQNGCDGCELTLHNILNILSEASDSITKRINIFIGNLALYKHKQGLINTLSKFKQYKFCIWLHDRDMEKIISFPPKKFQYDIIIIPKFISNRENILSNAKKIKMLGYSLVLHMYVTSEEEFLTYNKFFKGFNRDAAPYYDGSNLDFFKKNVFLSEKDILYKTIPMRKIFCNMKVNTNFFGSLNIYSDGSVNTKHGARILGNIHSDHLNKIIFNEMTSNTSWRKTRNNKKCNKCCYKYLCPPPNVYEEVLNNKSLCNVDFKKNFDVYTTH